MAAVSPTFNNSVKPGDGSVVLATWSGLNSSNNVGAAVEFPAHADRSVQFEGTYDSATAVLQGSNDGTNWGTLYDGQGNALSSTSNAAPKQIVEITRFIRPSTSGGGGSQAINCTIIMRRPKN